nr:TonB-dependent receptor [uncultured Carboxylicivirga sp.]
MLSKFVRIGLIICIIFSFHPKLFSQTTHIKGRVYNDQMEPVPFATIALENGEGTICDENGKFGLHAYAVSDFNLIISAIGFETESIRVKQDTKPEFFHINLRPKVTNLNEVTVEAQSLVTQINQTAYNVIAIDTKQMHNGTDNLASALKSAPGIKIRESGGVGSEMQLTLDGFTGKQVKLFIDGVPQDGVGQSFGLNNIPVNFADRFEIYRGVVPVGFGADALGGVINIVTNKQKRTFLDASYSYGSFNTHKSNVSFGKNTDSGFLFEFTFFQNYSDNSYRIYTPVKNFETGVWDSSKPEWVKRFNDNYHNEAVIAKVGITNKSFADRIVLSLTLSQNEKEIQNGVVQEIVFGQKRREGSSIMPSLEYCKKDLFVTNLDVTLTANLNINEFHNIDTSAYEFNWLGDSRYTGNLGEQTYQDSEFENINKNSTFTGRYTLNNWHNFVFNNVFTGFTRESVSQPDPELTTVSDATLMDKVSRKNISGLSYRYNHKDHWNLSLFGKYYNQYASGPNNVGTGNSTIIEKGNTNVGIFGYGAAATYLFMKAFQLKISAEKAVRLPTADQLFGDEDLELGASSLKPEKSDNFNASLSYKLEFGKHAIYTEGGLIYRNTRDYIRRTIEKLSGGLQAGSHVNHGRVVTKGVNASLRYNWSKNISMGGNFSYLNIRDKEKYVEAGSLQESTTYNVRIPNKPYLFSNMDICWKLFDFMGSDNELTLMYDHSYVHSFPLYWENHGSSNKKRVPNQFSHNLSVTYSMKEGEYNFSFECKNITDERLYDNFSLQKPGRAFYGKIRYYIKNN